MNGLRKYIGQKFNAWTIIDVTKKKHFLCQCECGTERQILYANLKYNKTKSCGCKNLKNWHALVGAKFGRLEVIGIGAKSDKGKHQMLLCRGDDGVVIEARYDHLKSGAIISTGEPKMKAVNPNWKGVGEIGKRWFSRFIKGAALRNIPFELTMEEAWEVWLQQNGKCALTGIQLSINDQRQKHLPSNASIDRKDPKKGYFKENIQFTTKEINMLKNKYNDEEFLSMCEQVVNYRSKKACAPLAG